MNAVGEPFRVGFTLRIQVKAPDSKLSCSALDDRADLIPDHIISNAVRRSLTAVFRKCAGRGNQNDIGSSGRFR